MLLLKFHILLGKLVLELIFDVHAELGNKLALVPVSDGVCFILNNLLRFRKQQVSLGLIFFGIKVTLWIDISYIEEGLKIIVSRRCSLFKFKFEACVFDRELVAPSGVLEDEFSDVIVRATRNASILIGSFGALKLRSVINTYFV